jgi:mannose-1-phosphate guanylyltransferase/phosphomannomutase
MRAVILAGGYGTRLRPLTYTRPKPMLPLAGKPILQHIIEFLASHDFHEIIVTENYLYELIEDYFGDGFKFGVEITYFREDKPLGTAGSVKNAERYLDDTFIVIQGDNLTDINLKSVTEFHKKRQGIATIALTPVENPTEFGIVELNKRGQIVRFLEKPKPEECFSNLVNMGLYVFEPSILDLIPKDKAYDFSKDLFPSLLEEKEIYGYEVRGFWSDIGRPESYLNTNRWVLSRLRKAPKRAPIKEGVLTEGAVAIEEDTTILTGARIFGPVIIGGGTKVESDVTIASNSAVGQRVKIGRGSTIAGSIIYEDTVIGGDSRLNYSVIGEGCEIGAGVTLSPRSVIGAGCKIGEKTEILPGTRIWPGIEIAPGSRVQGIVRYSKD